MPDHLKSSVAMLIGILPIFTSLQLPRPASACASVSRLTEKVQVVDESAVIIWDAATHQEHFIRRATFQSNSDDFGFLVPTPTVPALSEANDLAFRYLEQAIEPKVIEHKQADLSLGSLFFPPPQTAGEATKGMRTGSVRVLETQHVAGFDAVVLSADNADALRNWIQSHGYAAHPALLAWLTPYVQAHWKITAFKISKDNPRSTRTASAAVAMSFQTSRPFFPYREPADQRKPGHYSAARSLRVFFLSTARMEGVLGEPATSQAWPGKVVFANPIADAQVKTIGTYLPPAARQFSAKTWLTTFEDRSSPRPGTDDIYFAPATQQTSVVPSPVIETRVQHIRIPIEALVLLAGLGGFFWIKVRRKRYREAGRQPSY
jgi:hypothetical protein